MKYTKNKTSLLELKKDFSLMENGKDILEQKRNILLKEIISILDDVENLRKQLNESVLKSYNLLIKAFMEVGKDVIEKESELSFFKGNLEIYEKSFIGIPVPEIKFKLEKISFPIDATSESIFLELARKSFNETLELILKISEIEIKAWKLSEELKKTVIRVNALKNYYIPEYSKAIKDIKNCLEEVEREFLITIKKFSA